jgi:hypothetical protein
MKFTGLARVASVGVAVFSTAATCLVATPAAANAAPWKPKVPKVSVSTPAASPASHRGACPVTVAFSAKVKVKVSGKTVVAYRWLRGDGSKSKVTTRVVRGKGVKVLTVKEKATFKKSVKGWQALQVLSPRKVTTKKGHFTVSCHRPGKPTKPPVGKPPVTKPPVKKPPVTKPPVHKKPAYVKAFVDVPDYAGVCPPSGGVTAKGVIKVGRPALVKYRWIHNGKVVGTGQAKVVRDKKVSYTFTPRKSHKGSVTLDIVSPRHGVSGRDAYTVRCEKESDPPPPPPVVASATVTAPADYAGTCPVDRVFTGTITVDRIGADTAVQYRWAGPGFQGPTETLAFAEGDEPAKNVSHTVTVAAAQEGEVHRWIEILSPNSAQSNTGVVVVDCQDLDIEIIDFRQRIDSSVCGTPGYGPAVVLTASIRVNGPVRVEYEWEIDSAAGQYTVPGSFEADGPSTVNVSHRIESSPITASGPIRARIRVTSPLAETSTLDFAPPACPPSA